MTTEAVAQFYGRYDSGRGPRFREEHGGAGDLVADPFSTRRYRVSLWYEDASWCSVWTGLLLWEVRGVMRKLEANKVDEMSYLVEREN